MNLNGAMGLIRKADNPLIPLYEALTNSLEAIASKKFSSTETPKIIITLKFVGMIESVKELDTIQVFDNGIGFTDENFSRFSEFFNKSKGYNNRGTGRLQFYHRFKKNDVKSCYVNNEKFKERSFSCDAERFIYNVEEDVNTTSKESYSKISMSEPSLSSIEKGYFDDLTVSQLAHKITQKYLLRFYLDDKKEDYQVPEITLLFMKNDEEIGKEKLWEDDIPKPERTGSFKVVYSRINPANNDKINWLPIRDKEEEINWAHFKISQQDLDQNAIYLCSKDIAVQNFPIKEIKKNDAFNGNRYLKVFFGEALDKPENVSDSVDCFTFPMKKEIEKISSELFFDPDNEYLFFDDIEDKIKSEIPTIYEEIFTSLEERKTDVEEIAKSHGISQDITSNISISLADDEESITAKLYSAQSQKIAKQGYKVKKVFESLKALNPTNENYQEDLLSEAEELSSLVDEQNKEELSRYILRRDMVANILNIILNEELDAQKAEVVSGKRRDREGFIHDLIFKRKTQTNSLNDLWILNEEFLHFEGTSELPLLQIKNEKDELLLKEVPQKIIDTFELNLDRRPDIYLFVNEGKCVIIELKAAHVDVSDYLNQMPKYCTLIANYSKVPIQQFYCYLIGEKFNPLTDLNDYEETVTGDWIRQDMKIRKIGGDRETIAKQQIEIIRLSSIYERAHRRNKSFADKLGLRELLET